MSSTTRHSQAIGLVVGFGSSTTRHSQAIGLVVGFGSSATRHSQVMDGREVWRSPSPNRIFK
ncbi:hypothetical protein [Prochlorothrix hollandica]|uniref:hypothetical protein n=1 Tax=Prochlorothrix hollandica TaxID=1223 RepID=UPI0033408B70